ncbi:MAG: hypothetical protein A3J74_00255 [Elusimicrobia bacterium RIFCSPHIGHO2_02_FULL_57_9]|nr:MAG: hypothetical protein A3J74_00255 [Elusimicrobia bacterium RIFCSPHIGHO2_02_FULL_57_9]
MTPKNRLRGFSLLELMIVIAILSTLAAIVVPKFGDLLRKSKEGGTLANLGSLRSALNIYNADTEGIYPSSLLGLTQNARYLSTTPKIAVPYYHGATNAEAGSVTDAGGWTYLAATGAVMVNCTHTDTKGKVWTAY